MTELLFLHNTCFIGSESIYISFIHEKKLGAQEYVWLKMQFNHAANFQKNIAIVQTKMRSGYNIRFMYHLLLVFFFLLQHKHRCKCRSATPCGTPLPLSLTTEITGHIQYGILC